MKNPLLLIAAFVATGCSTFAAPRYGVSLDNLEAVRGSTAGSKLAVGDFSAFEPGASSLMCRAVGPVEMPDRVPFEGYIRKAFIDELKVAGAYDEASEVRLTAYIDTIELNSLDGTWYVALEVFPQTPDAFLVEHSYEFSPSWYANDACAQAANAFHPAVQDLVNKVFKHEKFKEVITR